MMSLQNSRNSSIGRPTGAHTRRIEGMITRAEAGTSRDFTPEELDAMHDDKGTSQALNEARRRAGQRGDDVTVRGDDGTLKDGLEAKKTQVSFNDVVSNIIMVNDVGGAIGVGV